MISIAAQWRVVRALGPAALALAGVPVTGPARPKGRRTRPSKRAQQQNAPGAVEPKNGHKAWK
jgi:hypothetical protein